MTVSSSPIIQTSPPLWKQFSNFTNSSPAGLEKLLRLIQALASIFAEVAISSSPELAIQCSAAKTQIALARRYFRFFKFIEWFEIAFAAVSPASSAGSDSTNSSDTGLVERSIEFGKWSCLGVYLILEDLTILDAMGIWSTQWTRDVFVESNRFWFYALSLSLLGSIWALFFSAESKSPASSSSSDKEILSEKEKKQPQPQQQQRSGKSLTPIVKRIVVDGCDLLIPGSSLGWIGANPTQVGVAMVVSTLVASQDIWIKAQGS